MDTSKKTIPPLAKVAANLLIVKYVKILQVVAHVIQDTTMKILRDHIREIVNHVMLTVYKLELALILVAQKTSLEWFDNIYKLKIFVG